MVPSRFNIIIPTEQKKPSYFLYNTFSDSQAEIGSDVLPLLQPGFKIDKKKKEKLLTKYAGNLKELGFLVESQKSEDKAVADWFLDKQNNHDYLQVTVLPTYKCNLACVYCFQSSINIPEKDLDMSKKNILRLVEWIGERMDLIHPRRLSLLFYGGEPLLRKREVLAISALVSDEARKRAVSFSIQMITNGTLLKPAFVNSMVPLGLECVKITLDGTKDKHNRLRVVAKGKGTFDIIIDNILKTKDKIDFVIGSNYELENFDSIPELFDYLVGIGLKKSIRRVNFRPIFQGGASHICDICSFSDSNPHIQFWLSNEARKRRFQTMDLLALGPCGFHHRNAYTIDPRGRIYKCEGLAGIEGAEIGDLNTKNIEERSSDFIARLDLFKKCGECRYLPICGGGCRYWSYARTGEVFGIACEKKYFDFAVQEILPARRET